MHDKTKGGAFVRPVVFWHDNTWYALAKEVASIQPSSVYTVYGARVFCPLFCHGQEAGEISQRPFCCLGHSQLQQGERVMVSIHVISAIIFSFHLTWLNTSIVYEGADQSMNETRNNIVRGATFCTRSHRRRTVSRLLLVLRSSGTLVHAASEVR